MRELDKRNAPEFEEWTKKMSSALEQQLERMGITPVSEPPKPKTFLTLTGMGGSPLSTPSALEDRPMDDGRDFEQDVFPKLEEFERFLNQVKPGSNYPQSTDTLKGIGSGETHVLYNNEKNVADMTEEELTTGLYEMIRQLQVEEETRDKFEYIPLSTFMEAIAPLFTHNKTVKAKTHRHSKKTAKAKKTRTRGKN